MVEEKTRKDFDRSIAVMAIVWVVLPLAIVVVPDCFLENSAPKETPIEREEARKNAEHSFKNLIFFTSDLLKNKPLKLPESWYEILKWTDKRTQSQDYLHRSLAFKVGYFYELSYFLSK
tara:strand:+ start:1514 stop:1870 length:357 start_codon:yes stop_codon:yes gene_type:complete